MHRVRCLGHIIHLAAHDFFFRRPSDTLGDGEKVHSPTPDDNMAWRDLGCYGKLHNIVVWIQRSPQRRNRFRVLSDLQLVRDNATRWHSYYDMCQRSLECRTALSELISTEVDLEAEYLSYTDWENISALVKFLGPYRHATKANEGLFDCIDRVLPGMEYLLEHHERAREQYAAAPFMATRIDAAWRKLNKYYNLTDKSIAYIGATVLNPTMKWRFFEDRWTEMALAETLEISKKRLHQYWTVHYAQGSPNVSQECLASVDCDEEDFDAFLHRDFSGNVPLDELELYCQEANLRLRTLEDKRSFRALRWWTEPTQRQRYPNLCKMAYDLLTVPATSAEIERVFSESSLALPETRQRLKPETLEKLQLLKSWLRNAKKKEDQTVSNPLDYLLD